MVLLVTIPGTCSVVFVILTVAALDLVVSGVVSMDELLPDSSTVLIRVFFLGGNSLLIGIRFHFGIDRNLGFQFLGFRCLSIPRHLVRTQCCLRCG